MRAAASNDLFWDRVVAIEPAGEEDVYDLTVPGPACWLADGIVSHNSGALEQDADLVVLIYRDDVYNKDPNNPDAGTAELILAKQRNGPTGVVKLAFLREQTRFANLAPGWGGAVSGLMVRSTVAHVDLAALQHNFTTSRASLGSRTAAARRRT